MQLVLLLGLSLFITCVVWWKSVRRQLLVIGIFSLLPFLYIPLLFPEFLSQLSSITEVAATAWQYMSLGLFIALLLSAAYHKSLRPLFTPVVHPDRWKLVYTVAGGIAFTLLLLLGVPAVFALTCGILLNLSIVIFLRSHLISDSLFSGLGMGILYVIVATCARYLIPSAIDDLWLSQNVTGFTPLGVPVNQIPTLLLLGLLWGPLYLATKEPKQIEIDQQFEPHHLRAKQLALLIFVVTILSALCWFGFTYILRPQTVLANLSSTLNVRLDKEVSLTFSRPIDRTAIQFRISPDIEGTWELRDTSLGNRVFRTLAFTPKEYFLPDQQYTIYTEDIRTVLQTPQDNYSYTFRTEPIPKISTITPKEGSTQVAVCEPLRVEFTSALAEYWQPKFMLDPKVELITTKSDRAYILKAPQCLEQGTAYTLSVFNRPASSTEDSTEPLETIRFQTKQAPGLTNHAPQGSAVLTSIDKIEMTFNQPMQSADISQYATITPSLPGSWQWDEGNVKLRYVPSQALAYGTRYTVTLKKGLPDQDNGFLVEDTSFTFTTIGPVTATLSSPSPGSKAVKTDNTIVVQFNQEVDHESAQEHFAIEPKVNGTFSWKGNELTFRPSASLAYSTEYSIGVRAGVKSLHGLDLPRDYNVTFTTKTPPPIPITLGHSEKGRAINGYIFGSGHEVIFLFGAIHGGKEKSTGMLLETFVQELSKDPSRVSKDKTIIIAPITNPDGYSERTDKLNSRGVNLNRNFDTSDWTQTGWDTEGSIGSTPFSEKESQVIKNIVEKYGVDSMFAYHSKGSMTNPEHGHTASQRLAQWYAQQTGYSYYEDMAWNYPGTATRWFVEHYNRAGVTVELTSHTVPDWSVHKKALFGLVQ